MLCLLMPDWGGQVSQLAFTPFLESVSSPFPEIWDLDRDTRQVLFEVLYLLLSFLSI